MTKLHIYHPDRGFRDENGLDHLGDLLKEEKTVVWVEMKKPADKDVKRLGDLLRLHALAREGLQDDGERPTLRRYGDFLSIHFFALEPAQDGKSELRFHRVNMLAGRRVFATIQQEEIGDIQDAYTAWKGNADHLPDDTSAPLYSVLDSLMDGYFPVMDAIADRVDDAENRAVEEHSEESLGEIFALKKSMLHFRRMVAGARDVVNMLLRHDDLFGSDSSLYFQDVYDHVVRITDSVDTYRDLLSNAMDTYLTVISNELADSSNRLNVTMQTLTSWSIVIGAGAVITGFYGMNVSPLPGAKGHHGIVYAVGVLVVTTLVLLTIFRRKRWI